MRPYQPWFTANYLGDFHRSTPVYNFLQVGADSLHEMRVYGTDSLALEIDIQTGQYYDLGFTVPYGSLCKLLDSVFIVEGSNFAMNLWFDVGGDGEFFRWRNGVMTDLGVDAYGLCDPGTSRFTSRTRLDMRNGTGWLGFFTLADLMGRKIPRIGPETHVGMWIGIASSSKGTTESIINALTFDGTTVGPLAVV